MGADHNQEEIYSNGIDADKRVEMGYLSNGEIKGKSIQVKQERMNILMHDTINYRSISIYF